MKERILSILPMNTLVLTWCQDMLSCILCYRNLEDDLLSGNVKFPICPMWKFGWGFPCLILGIHHFSYSLFATGCPKTQINKMELISSLLHEGKYGHHCFFMKYGSICHSVIYIKTDIFLPESMEFSVSPLSGWKCSLRQSVTSIFQGEKANGDISGRNMVISALPKNFSFWNRWFFFFFL